MDKQGINWLPGKPEWKASLLMESVDLVCLLHVVRRLVVCSPALVLLFLFVLSGMVQKKSQYRGPLL